MCGRSHAPKVVPPSQSSASADPFALNVITMTRDSSLARNLARVCAERGHSFSQLETLGMLHTCLSRRLPNVLLLDWDGEPAEGASVAATVSSVHPEVEIVLGMPTPRQRSVGAFRVIDRSRGGDRLVDELELAYIAIPPAVAAPEGEPVRPKG